MLQDLRQGKSTFHQHLTSNSLNVCGTHSLIISYMSRPDKFSHQDGLLRGLGGCHKYHGKQPTEVSDFGVLERNSRYLLHTQGRCCKYCCQHCSPEPPRRQGPQGSHDGWAQSKDAVQLLARNRLLPCARATIGKLAIWAPGLQSPPLRASQLSKAPFEINKDQGVSHLRAQESLLLSSVIAEKGKTTIKQAAQKVPVSSKE